MIDSIDNSMAAPFRDAVGSGAVSPETDTPLIGRSDLLAEAENYIRGNRTILGSISAVLLRIGTPGLMS